MNIAFLAGYSPSLPRLRGPLLRAMSAAGHRVTALAPDDDPRARHELARLDVDFQAIPLRRAGLNPLADLGTLAALRRALRDLSPDLVLSSSAKAVIWGSLAARQAGVPRIYALITGLGRAFFLERERPGLGRRVLNLAARALFRRSLPACHGLLFQNQDDRDLFQRLGLLRPGQAALVTAGSGVDLEHFAPAEPVLPDPVEGGPVFLTLTRMLLAKGLPEFVEAARTLKALYPAAEFRACGPLETGPGAVPKARLEAWAKERLGGLRPGRGRRAARAVAGLGGGPGLGLPRGSAPLPARGPGHGPARGRHGRARVLRDRGPGPQRISRAAPGRGRPGLGHGAVHPGPRPHPGHGRGQPGPDRGTLRRAYGERPDPGVPGARMKRLVDLVLGSALLVLCAPVLGLAALAVRLDLGPGVLFRQIRSGLHGRPFTLSKLRTMRPGPGPNSERLTRLGRLLRAGALDELPELWNVLRGDISLVGPRPLLPEYLGRYTPRQARRLEARPGTTGWAQVNGRNALTWEERFELDVWYVEHQSLALDARILWRTLGCVLSGQGVTAPGSATMPEFLGSSTEDSRGDSREST